MLVMQLLLRKCSTQMHNQDSTKPTNLSLMFLYSYTFYTHNSPLYTILHLYNKLHLIDQIDSLFGVLENKVRDLCMIIIKKKKKEMKRDFCRKFSFNVLCLKMYSLLFLAPIYCLCIIFHLF